MHCKPWGIDMGRYDFKNELEDHVDDFKKMEDEDLARKIMNPGHVDEGLWDKAKRASEDAFGRVKWPFVQYLYRKWGGT